jgi:transcription elongation factor Elf1
MSPGKEKFKVLPASKKIKILQKEAKQLFTGPYDCPSCTKTLLQIVISKNNEVHATCTCGIDEKLTYAPVFQGVDYYSKFMDEWKREHGGGQVRRRRWY